MSAELCVPQHRRAFRRPQTETLWGEREGRDGSGVIMCQCRRGSNQMTRMSPLNDALDSGGGEATARGSEQVGCGGGKDWNLSR